MEIDNNFFIGMTNTAPILEQLRKLINKEFEEFLDMVYDIPEKLGKNCLVEIVLSSGNATKGTRFLYGADSMGPPRPIVDFVLKAKELTDPWFIQQQQMVRKAGKKWWEFWK
jgi:hypothetical protein